MTTSTTGRGGCAELLICSYAMLANTAQSSLRRACALRAHIFIIIYNTHWREPTAASSHALTCECAACAIECARCVCVCVPPPPSPPTRSHTRSRFAWRAVNHHHPGPRGARAYTHYTRTHTHTAHSSHIVDAGDDAGRHHAASVWVQIKQSSVRTRRSAVRAARSAERAGISHMHITYASACVQILCINGRGWTKRRASTARANPSCRPVRSSARWRSFMCVLLAKYARARMSEGILRKRAEPRAPLFVCTCCGMHNWSIILKLAIVQAEKLLNVIIIALIGDRRRIV